MKTLKRNSTVTVIGRRWFDRINGNTYHSCTVHVNGDEVGHEPFEYGYGNQWEHTGLELLKKAFKIPDDVTALWKLKEHGINLVTTCTDVQRKKDL